MVRGHVFRQTLELLLLGHLDGHRADDTGETAISDDSGDYGSFDDGQRAERTFERAADAPGSGVPTTDTVFL